MPTFSQQPLTWLYALAYSCAMAASLVGGPEQAWAGILLVAGIYMAGAAPALSQRHRLTRAALFVSGVTAANLMVIVWDRFRGQSVALILAMACASFAAAAVTRRVVGIRAVHSAQRATAWRISIIEVLGWMIVVAIMSVALRFAEFNSLTISYDRPLWMYGLVAGVLAGLFLTPERRCDRVATVLATAIAGGALYGLPRLTDDWYDGTGYLALVYALVGLWILVLRLDESAAARISQHSAASPSRRASPGMSQDQ
jgi:hypothetical protein